MANPRNRHVVSQSATVFANGRRIGSIQDVKPNEALSSILVRELDADVAGQVIEIAIGVPTYTVSVTKLKLFQETFFQALGYVVKNIGDIVSPLDLQLTLTSGLTGNVLVKTFVDATIESLGEPVSIGTILVTESASFKVKTII